MRPLDTNELEALTLFANGRTADEMAVALGVSKSIAQQASIKRSRRSWEHGFGIVRLHKRIDARRLVHNRSTKTRCAGFGGRLVFGNGGI